MQNVPSKMFDRFLNMSQDNLSIMLTKSFPLNTGRKLSSYKTFIIRPGRLLNVLCKFNFRSVFRGFVSKKLIEKGYYNRVLLTSFRRSSCKYTSNPFSNPILCSRPQYQSVIAIVCGSTERKRWLISETSKRIF